MTKINVGYSAKVMIRQYEPIESTMSVEVEINEEDDVNEVVRKMQNYCEQKVIDALPDQAKNMF